MTGTEVMLSRRCHLYGEGRTVFFRAASPREDDGGEALSEALRSMGADDFTLFDVEVTDWAAELSPWAAETGDERFSGGGVDTLRFLTEEALPWASAHRPAGLRFIAGYSLSALFALWAFYESGEFDGTACCSGSLWFPGWAEYAEKRSAPTGAAVYLSLGGKEPGRGRPPMNSIGVAYDRQTRLCQADRELGRFRMEMNPGGHFSNPVLRVAKGLRWLMEK